MPLSRIAEAARKYPSGDNSQPFRISLKGEELEVSFDPALAKHLLDYDQYASLLTLGCVLENVRVAALSEGLITRYALDPKNPLETFSITFTREGTVNTELFEAISERCTDRRDFEKTDISFFEDIRRDLKDHYRARFEVVSTLPQNVRTLLVDCDGVIWKDANVFFDIMKWVRFTKEEALRTRDGLTTANLDLNLSARIILWLTTRNTFMHKFFGAIGGKREGRKIIQKQLDHSAGFLFIYLSEDSKMGIVECGRLGQRLWLELTRRNLGAQPITLSTLMTYLSDKAPLKEFHPDVTRLLLEGSKIMKSELGLPVWGFRFGKTKSRFPDKARTYRRG